MKLLKKIRKRWCPPKTFEPSLGAKTSFSNFSGMDSANDTGFEVVKSVTLGLVVYKMDSTIHWIMQKAISEFEKLFTFKTRLIVNPSCENELYLRENKNRFRDSGFALGLALKQRLETTLKWSIV